MERHLPYEITQCYLPPDTGERARCDSKTKSIEMFQMTSMK